MAVSTGAFFRNRCSFKLPPPDPSISNGRKMYNPTMMEFQACRQKWKYPIGANAHSAVWNSNRANKHFKVVLCQSAATMRLNLTRHCTVICHFLEATDYYLFRSNNRSPCIEFHRRTIKLGKYRLKSADKCLPQAYSLQGKVPVKHPQRNMSTIPMASLYL